MNQNVDESAWLNNPILIKTFIEQRSMFEQLCHEVAYILEIAIEKEDIEYSAITSRAKTLNSFLEKIVRKKYKDPFKEITDFAGTRLVFLYSSDFKRIEDIINNTFTVIEKVDKLNDKGVDKFGYGAIHYIVELTKKHSGARYDSLKNLRCEIQVRTVLQDAWSIIDHHLIYKNESSVPQILKRKLNSLAGLFETADDQFNQIRTERESYIEIIHESKNRPEEFLDTDLNLDSFKEYLKWKIPELPIKTFDEQVEICFEIIKSDSQFKKLKDIDKNFEINKDRFEKIKTKLNRVTNSESSSAYLTVCLAIDNKTISGSDFFAHSWLELVRTV